MRFLDKAVELEKALLKKIGPREGVARQAFEIYRAVLDEIEDNTEPTGRAGRTFPYNQLLVSVAAATPRRRASMEAVFAEAPPIKARVAERLRERGCPAPADLDVVLRIVDAPLPEWEGRDFHVDYRRRSVAPKRAAAAPSGPPEVRLTVVKGKASKKTCAVAATRIELGRLREVTDETQQVVRRNHVAFLDSPDELNQTVSRQHAHIQYVPATGEFRLHDDNSTHGTRVLREGRTIDVPRGGSRGVKLKTGDEILLGHARVRFDVIRVPA